MWLIERNADSKRNELCGVRVEINRSGDIDEANLKNQINLYFEMGFELIAHTYLDTLARQKACYFELSI